MKILLFGKTGQLGWELQRTLAPLGEVYAFGSSDLNLANLTALDDLIRDIKPEIIVNASAYTAVDRAEQESDLAMLINARAPAVMAVAARELKAAFLHFSTDYVFDGEKTAPYIESDPTAPVNGYGESKLKGEQGIIESGCAGIILRTSWVYSLRGDSFVTKTLAWARKQETLRIVSDQIGSPTWARMLAQASSALVAQSLSSPEEYFSEYAGVYHLAGSGSVSRFDFSRAVLRFDPQITEQIVNSVIPVPTTDFPTPARRPLYTPLDCSRFEASFGIRLPDWEYTLKMAMNS